MKTKFPGYYQLSFDQIKELWDTATIVLDTNVLLDFYRVSKQTSTELLGILGNYAEQGRIFIPFQSACEYHENILTVISGQKKMYDEALKDLEKFNECVAKKRSHPFMDEGLNKEFNALYNKIKDNFNEKQKNLDHLLTENEIKDKLGDMLNGMVGDGLTKEELEMVYQEGEKRYEQKIPPGYKDIDKKGNEKYGDLVVWKEIVQYAKNEDKPIIFVSSDTKSDWYQIQDGKKIGPLPQLREEFFRETEQIIHFYTLDQFLNHAKQEGMAKVSNETIDEIINLFELWKTHDSPSLTFRDQSISSSSNNEKDSIESKFDQVSALAKDWTFAINNEGSVKKPHNEQSRNMTHKRNKKNRVKRKNS